MRPWIRSAKYCILIQWTVCLSYSASNLFDTQNTAPLYTILDLDHSILTSFIIYIPRQILGRSQRPRGLRRRSAAARLLRLWVRIPSGAWMCVFCDCRVLSGIGLCDELITRPEKFYWLVRRCVWSRNFANEGAVARWGLSRHKQTKPNIRRVINWRRMTWVGRMARMGRKTLSRGGGSEEGGHSENLSIEGRIILKYFLNRIGRRGTEWCGLGYVQVTGFCTISNEHSGTGNTMGFLE